MWIPFLIKVKVPVVILKKPLLLCVRINVRCFFILVKYTDLFKISTNSVTGPLLPLVALAIC